MRASRAWIPRQTFGCLAWLIIGSLSQSNIASAQLLDSTVSLGQSARLWSRVLQEERRILIAMPASYSKTSRAYPVLYVLDAETQFVNAAAMTAGMAKNDVIPEMIVVGITNTDRNRDLTPEGPYHHSNGGPMRGAATAFSRFLSTELQPWVAARYRVAPYRILAGHSNGGLFALYVIMSDPDSYSAYIAMSPSHGDDMNSAATRAIRALQPNQFVFLSSGDHEPNIRPATERLADQLSRGSATGARWTYRHFEHENHRSSVLPAMYAALRALFEGYFPDDLAPPDVMALGMSARELAQHYDGLSRRLGLTLSVPAGAYASSARAFSDAGAVEAWLSICEAWVGAFPYSGEASGQLGDALVTAGRRSEAHRAYERSIELATGEEDPYGWLSSYRRKAGETATKGR